MVILWLARDVGKGRKTDEVVENRSGGGRTINQMIALINILQHAARGYCPPMRAFNLLLFPVLLLSLSPLLWC